MLFFDYTFLFVFLPAFLLIYAILPTRAKNAWILAGSLLFYAGSSFAFLPILVFSITVDYLVGRRITASEGRGRRAWLFVSLGINLGLLGYFKYVGLFTTTLQELGLTTIPIVEAALPVGISFFTFQSMSYSIDLYRRQIEPARSFVDFAAYVAMFPQLIAGPIVRFSQIEDALVERDHSDEKLVAGVQQFILGLGKKLLLADTAAALASPIFADADPTLPEAWIAMFLFSCQIYFDFSGYTDMAIGLGRLLGFELPKNFDSPYRSASFSEFWRRWHITLSSWLRDNLYIPLGGNRYGPLRTYFSLFATMLLGGLWHGASWTFVTWGALHGAYLAVERALRAQEAPRTLPRIALVYVGTLIAWVFFRHATMDAALFWLGRMFGGALRADLPWELWAALPILALSIWGMPNTNQFAPRLRPRHIPALGVLFAVSLWVVYGRGLSPFIYFRF